MTPSSPWQTQRKCQTRRPDTHPCDHQSKETRPPALRDSPATEYQRGVTWHHKPSIPINVTADELADLAGRMDIPPARTFKIANLDHLLVVDLAVLLRARARRRGVVVVVCEGSVGKVGIDYHEAVGAGARIMQQVAPAEAVCELDGEVLGCGTACWGGDGKGGQQEDEGGLGKHSGRVEGRMFLGGGGGDCSVRRYSSVVC